MITCGCMFIATRGWPSKQIGTWPSCPAPLARRFLIYGTGIRNPSNLLKINARPVSNIRYALVLRLLHWGAGAKERLLVGRQGASLMGAVPAAKGWGKPWEPHDWG